MISWRYHLVSIIAVFLALALGVLAGTAVVNQNLVANLKNTTDRLTQELKDNSDRTASLTKDVRYLTEYADEAMREIVSLRLSQVDVVIVTDGNVDPAARDEAKAALSAAGARIVTTLVPLPKLTSTDPADVKTLAGLIGAPSQTDPSQLPALVAQTLALRIAQGPPTARPGQQDVLGSLLSGGFLDSVEPGVKSAADLLVPAAVLVIGGSTQGSITAPSAFLVPLVRALSEQRIVVAAGEGRVAPDGFISLVRRDSVVIGPRVTVDDLASAMGGTALAIGLQRALDQGVSGDYGTDSGQLLPPLS